MPRARAGRAEPSTDEPDDDAEGARLIALNMALNGTSREETDRYLAENFDLADRESLLTRSTPPSRAERPQKFPQRPRFARPERLFGHRRLTGWLRPDQIVVSGAREHNLKDVTVALPRDALVVITGLSGSGKSSLAFDTIYAEGQRRYVESLSAYARQFLGQMDKPDVDSIEGLSPAISIDQKTTSRNPRSTVGTVTEIYDYLRLLWSRIGQPHCHICGKPIAGQSAEQIIDQVIELPEGTRFMVLAPIVRGRKGEYGKLFDELRAEGFSRVVVDGELRLLEEPIVLDKKFKHDISLVVDRLVMRDDIRKRLADSIETAVALADGMVEVETVPREGEAPERWLYSEKFACPDHGPVIPELEPRIFSFNSPHGACERCTGLGSQMEIDPELVVPDPDADDRRGRDRAVGDVVLELLRAARPGAGRRVRHQPRMSLGEALARRAGALPLRHQRQADPHLLPQPLRAQAVLCHPLRRRRGRASSAATRRPTPRTSASGSRSSCRWCRARRARARGCGPSRVRCCSAAWRSTSSRPCPCGGRASGWRRSSSPRPTATSPG